MFSFISTTYLTATSGGNWDASDLREIRYPCQRKKKIYARKTSDARALGTLPFSYFNVCLSSCFPFLTILIPHNKAKRFLKIAFMSIPIPKAMCCEKKNTHEQA
jgi:hypothetical protein